MTETEDDWGLFGPVFHIAPGLQTYAWGLPGATALVAHYAFDGTGPAWLAPHGYDADTPYAELWLGSHPSGPCFVKPPGLAQPDTARTELATYLRAHPALLSPAIIARYGTSGTSPLPFLFKVLSVGTALSIQAHPDKRLAEQLHAQHPEIYRDDNHKPEMAVALTYFRGFCGFRPLREIHRFLIEVTELAQLVAGVLGVPEAELLQESAEASSDGATDAQRKSVLRRVFEAVMTAPHESVVATIDRLLARWDAGDLRPSETAAADTEAALTVPDEVRLLHTQFPHDVGVLCTFLLNLLHLAPGEALFLGADEPHAYLAGEIVECMAASDNVVRAGLTPKLRDTPTLISMLTYDDSPADAKRLLPAPWDGASGTGTTTLYAPPVDEVRVLRTRLAGPGSEETHRAIRGPSVLIATKGHVQVTFPLGGQTDAESSATDGGLDLGEGAAAFAAPGVPLTITSRSRPGEEVEVFRAFVEV